MSASEIPLDGKYCGSAVCLRGMCMVRGNNIRWNDQHQLVDNVFKLELEQPVYASMSMQMGEKDNDWKEKG